MKGYLIIFDGQNCILPCRRKLHPEELSPFRVVVTRLCRFSLVRRKKSSIFKVMLAARGAKGRIPVAYPLHSPVRVSDLTRVPKADPRLSRPQSLPGMCSKNKTSQKIRSETSSRELKRKRSIVLFGEEKEKVIVVITSFCPHPSALSRQKNQPCGKSDLERPQPSPGQGDQIRP